MRHFCGALVAALLLTTPALAFRGPPPGAPRPPDRYQPVTGSGTQSDPYVVTQNPTPATDHQVTVNGSFYSPSKHETVYYQQTINCAANSGKPACQ